MFYTLNAQQIASSVNAKPSAYQEWEYMVITYGKTYFSDAEKNVKYYSFTNKIGEEGTELQKCLDGLGSLDGN